MKNGLLIVGVASLATAAQAQSTITPLIVEGDSTPIGNVTRIDNNDVNDNGDWLVELDTDNTDAKKDAAVYLNGTMIHAEGTAMGIPAPFDTAWVYDSFVDSMDINDNGDVMILMNAEDVNLVVSDTKLVLWTNGATGTTYVLMEQGVTPNTVAGEPAGAVWSSIGEVWQNNNNEIMISGRSDSDSDDMLAMLTHDGMGNITSQTVFAMDNVVHSTAFPPSNGTHADTVQGFASSKQNMALNNAGQKMFYVDDQSFGAGGMPDYTTVDAHFYVDTTEIAWEGDDAPTPGPWPYNHLSSAEVDINDSGVWAAVWDDDGDTSQDFFINRNGTVFVQEGFTAPGIPGGFVLTGPSYGHVQISDQGDLTWYGDWDDADTDKDSGLFRNHDLLIQEGVTMIGSEIVDTISTSSDGMAVSDSGRFIIIELTLANGNEGSFLIDIPNGISFCFGDGTGTVCPCGNSGGAGEGCGNSTGAGGVLTAAGVATVGADTLVLNAEQVPAGVPGVFFQANNSLANPQLFGDGFLCATGGIQRLGSPVFTDAGGNGASAVTISVFGAVNTGDTKNYQFWYRDVSGPCASGFNTTNALELTWL